MKIIKAMYGCQYCNFENESAKVVGKHEYTCVHNPKTDTDKQNSRAKAVKAHKRTLIYKAKSLSELNELLFNYLQEYYSSFNWDSLIRTDSKSVWRYTVGIQNCKLQFPYNILRTLHDVGISTKTEDYIVLAPLLKEMNEINKIHSVYSKEFKTHLTPLLNAYKKTAEIKDIEAKVGAVSIEINKLLEIRHKLDSEIKILEDAYILQVKNDYNWIDYQSRLKEIKNILGIE
jgi:hypothetical protein